VETSTSRGDLVVTDVGKVFSFAACLHLPYLLVHAMQKKVKWTYLRRQARRSASLQQLRAAGCLAPRIGNVQSGCVHNHVLSYSLCRCGNVNWARRNSCNICNEPKFGKVEARTGQCTGVAMVTSVWHQLGFGGGYNERDEIVEYKDRDDSDGELDEVCYCV